jgi:glycerol-3-phosphate dehydrogenase
MRASSALASEPRTAIKTGIPATPPSQPLHFQSAREIRLRNNLSLARHPASGFGDERRNAFRAANGADYDVAIFGAGISGARIFHELCRHGYRVLLLDRGDFAGGTSQASGMMIWGGLLYLKDFHFRTVIKLCRARDQLIKQMPEKIRAESLRYLPGRESLRNRHVVRFGMMLYWLLGSLNRRFPGRESAFAELEVLKAGRFRHSLTVEEAVLKTSDCRFALEWILPFIAPETPALNHCATESARFDAAAGRWRFELRDRLHGHEAAVTARFVVNAAGVWTDTVNESLGIESPYRHELSKGVYISFRRPESLRQILVFDTGKDEDTLTFVPWGPVALCGPTETRIAEIGDGFNVSPEDIRSLLLLANQNLHTCYGVEDIISLRCGIRPLAVRRGFSGAAYPLELSRKHLIHHDQRRQAVAVYGGKLTSCGLLAEQVRTVLATHLRAGRLVLPPTLETPATEFFPGLDEPVPAAAWCRDREHCHTLEDYLRRRTNIAQWIPRGGLGVDSENLEPLRQIARVFCRSESAADEAIAAYQHSVRERHDDVLASA